MRRLNLRPSHIPGQLQIGENKGLGVLQVQSPAPREPSFQLRINPNGKEVILVKYTKPEIVLAADAVSAIQNMTKPFGGPDNDIPELRTTPAYESDE